MSNSGSAVPQLTFRAVLLGHRPRGDPVRGQCLPGPCSRFTIATAIPGGGGRSMGVLRLLGGGTILENNIVRPAPAGSSIAAGVIFTIPR